MYKPIARLALVHELASREAAPLAHLDWPDELFDTPDFQQQFLPATVLAMMPDLVRLCTNQCLEMGFRCNILAACLVGNQSPPRILIEPQGEP